MTKRIRNLLVCISQALNALTGGRPNEMLSAKLHRLRLPYVGTASWKVGTACVVCKLFDYLFLEADHCLSAYRSHVRRLRETMEEDERFTARYIRAAQAAAEERAQSPLA